MDISHIELTEIKNINPNLLSIDIEFDGETYYVCVDILLHIFSFLTSNEILDLSRVSKNLYGLCRSNYVWGSRLFRRTEHIPESTLKKIYQNNWLYFQSYDNLQNYVHLDYRLNGNSARHHYLDLFQNMINIVPQLCAPYRQTEILPIFRSAHLHMIHEEPRYEKVIYIMKSVDTLPEINDMTYLYKFQKQTDEFNLLIILKKNQDGQLEFRKYIQPQLIPHDIIKKVKTFIFAESINRLLDMYPYQL